MPQPEHQKRTYPPRLFAFLFRFLLIILFPQVFLVIGAKQVSAAGYVPLAPLPGVNSAGTNLPEYLQALFTIGIGLAGLLAILMLAYAIVEYLFGVASEAIKKDAKERMWRAVWGFILAASSWLLLYTINPNILGDSVGTFVSLPSFSSPPSIYIPPPPTPPPPPVPPPPPIPPLPLPPPEIDFNFFAPGTLEYGDPITITWNVKGADSCVAGGDWGGSKGKNGFEMVPKIISGQEFTITCVGGGGSESKTITIGSLPSPYPPGSSDYVIVSSCMGRPPSGPCANTDFDDDGDVDIVDLNLLVSLFIYDFNGSGAIEFTSAKTVNSCFFKYNNAPPPLYVANPLYLGWETPPQCYPGSPDLFYSDNRCIKTGDFPTQCASGIMGGATFDVNTVVSVQNVIGSLGPKVDLFQLYYNLCIGIESDSFLSGLFCGYNTAALNQDIRKMLYSTLYRYDLNGDGYADFSISRADEDGDGYYETINAGGSADAAIFLSCRGNLPTGSCAKADLNEDGAINNGDVGFYTMSIDSIFTSDISFYPIGFSVNDLETYMFDGSQYRDIEILQYCVGRKVIGWCTTVDIDQNGVNNSIDSTLFNTGIEGFDVNGDGVINISPPS